MGLQLSTVLNGERRIWPLEDERLTVGRSSKHAVHLPDATVSKDHAEIALHEGGWAVRDLGSRNGTRVNGVEASQAISIREGDMVEIGKVMLRVGREAAAPLDLSTVGSMSSSMRLRAQDILGRPTAPIGADSSKVVRLLAEAGRMLVLPRPLPETCESVLAFVEKALPASRLVILLRDKQGAEPVQMAARYKGGASRQPLAMSRTIMDTVLNECTSVVTGDALADSRFRMQQSIVAASIHSAMAVPLFDNERVLGLMYADSTDPGVIFGQEQLEIFTLLANMAAVKITNSRLLQAEQQRARMEQELATASRIQRSLLPAPPALAGLQCNARCETCFEVGGDLYDFHVRSDGRFVFIVGDVSGKGMGASLLMSSVLSSSRVLYDTCLDPAEFLGRLNAVVHRSTEAGHFVTLFFGCLDVATGQLDYVNAGHNAPMLVRDGKLLELEATGIPLAILPSFPYTKETVTLGPGELLAVFSDGIPEAVRDGEFFDNERLGQALIAQAGTASLEEAGDRLLAEVETFLAGTPRSDDVTLVLLRRE
jgi:sigma-B regulation protein RsbU (phosphoserine phosphatase)